MSLQEIYSDELVVREAAEVVGRTVGSIRGGIKDGTLTGRRLADGWRIRRADLLAWHEAHPPIASHSSTPWELAAEALAEYGPMTVNELAKLLSKDRGTVRKHAAILGQQGRATRLPDGQWVLVDKQHAGAA